MRIARRRLAWPAVLAASTLLATVIAKRAPDAVITTEVHQGVIRSAVVTLPPSMEPGPSTIAGLDLTPKDAG